MASWFASSTKIWSSSISLHRSVPICVVSFALYFCCIIILLPSNKDKFLQFYTLSAQASFRFGISLPGFIIF